jgi:hypothetical protein
LIRRRRDPRLRQHPPASRTYASTTNAAQIGLRFVGVDVAEAGGSLLPVVRPVRDYLAEINPTFASRAQAAVDLAERIAAESALAAVPMAGARRTRAEGADREHNEDAALVLPVAALC